MALGVLVFIALVLLPAGAAGGAGLGAEGKLLVRSQRLKPLHGMPKVWHPLRRSGPRKLLQTGMPLCYWEGGNCDAVFFLDAPDDTFSKFSNYLEMCTKITSIDDCFAQGCVWNLDIEACDVNPTVPFEECILPEYTVFLEFAQCLASQQSTCAYLPGCQWDASNAACAGNDTALAQAIDSSIELSQAFLQNLLCQASDTCEEPCVEADACTYPKLRNMSQWFLPTAKSTICQFGKLQFGCLSFSAGNSTCSGACELDDAGNCSVRGTAVIEKIYENSAEKRDKWLNVQEACVAIKDPDECVAFTGQ